MARTMRKGDRVNPFRLLLAAAVSVSMALPSSAALHAVKGVSPAVFYGSGHAVEDGDAAADLAVIVVHGWGGGAKERDPQTLAADLSARGAKPYIVSPLFPRRSVLKKAGVADDGRAVWGDSWETPGAADRPADDWRGGGDATGTSLSSFDVVDCMIGMLCDKARYPALRRIVLAGFSAGGQFAGRYAAVGRCPLRDGVDMGFAVIAPSTELRLEPEASWHYGLKGRPRYSAAMTHEAIRANLASRRVWRGCGTEDVRRGALDVAPLAMRQGENRYERYLNFKEYIKGFPDWSAKVSFHDIPGVGHDARVFRDAALLDFIVSGGGAPGGRDTGRASQADDRQR